MQGSSNSIDIRVKVNRIAEKIALKEDCCSKMMGKADDCYSNDHTNGIRTIRGPNKTGAKKVLSPKTYLLVENSQFLSYLYETW